MTVSYMAKRGLSMFKEYIGKLQEDVRPLLSRCNLSFYTLQHFSKGTATETQQYVAISSTKSHEKNDYFLSGISYTNTLEYNHTITESYLSEAKKQMGEKRTSSCTHYKSNPILVISQGAICSTELNKPLSV